MTTNNQDSLNSSLHEEKLEMSRPVKVSPFQFNLLTVHQGTGQILPNDFSVCRIFLRVLAPEPNPYPIGYELNKETEIIIGLGRTYISCVVDLTLQMMVEGGVAVVTFPNTEMSELVLEVVLISFQIAEEVYKLGPEAKFDRAFLLKSIGTEAFQTKCIEVAFYKFSRSLKYLLCIRNVDELDSDVINKIIQLRCQCYLNISACQLQVNSFTAVLENCSNALKIDASNVKGLFRRAQAFMGLKEYEKARNDLVRALAIEPNNAVMNKLLALVKAALKEETSELAKSMSKMFQ